VCGDTADGWIYYCDVCDTHGNADTEVEALFMARMHSVYWTTIGEAGSDEDEHDLHVFPRGNAFGVEGDGAA
jgi:hypothetical protein